MLTAVRAVRAGRDEAEIEIIESVVDWRFRHETDDEDSASFGDHGIPLAGDGAPWVLETRYRLPRTWERVAADTTPPATPPGET